MLWACRFAGIDNPKPRFTSPAWQPLQPFFGLAASVRCCAWSNLTLKVSLKVSGKTLQAGLIALHVSVADHTHRNLRCGELSAVAVGACTVTRESGCR